MLLMTSIASVTGARRLLAVSIVARLPLTMLSIALLVHAEHLTGSFAAAGVVTGIYAVALGVGGPLLGRLVDARGQTPVLVASGAAAAALLCAMAALPVGAPLPLLVVLASGVGLATPPVGACLRSLLAATLPDARQLRAAYAVEASAVELTWVSGPPLALAVGAVWGSGAALAAGGAVMLVATLAFAAEPGSRAWRPAERPVERQRGGSLRSPAMRTLVIVLVAVGVLFGAVEVAVTAAASAMHGATAAAPLLALWGAGSLVGGMLAARLGDGIGLGPVLAALAAGHLMLLPAAGSLVALGAVLLLAGSAIAPTYSAIYAMVDDAAPAGTITEAFAWLGTATAIGAAAGSAAAGALADHADPATAFALAGAAGAVAVLVAVMRSETLPAAVALPEPAAA